VSESPAPNQTAPEFEVQVDPPDLGALIDGNTGLAGVTTYDSGVAGPHVALTALMHGNEYGGAIALAEALRAGVRPTRGRLSIGFLNIAAFERFDSRRPTLSRFVDEDMNRLWDRATLDGPRHSVELDRARELRPWVDTLDVVVDLHSMLWPSDPVTLCGMTAQGRALAEAAAGGVIVADRGHENGRRLIDYSRFADPARSAILIEAGEHWKPPTVQVARRAVAGLLRHTLCVPPMGEAAPMAGRFAEVTDTITATTAQFHFVQPFRGGHVVAERNTLIALDGEAEIRTPYDDCLLVLPTLRPARGHTAVRLARFAPPKQG
jgi:predicted deacylase